MDRRCFLAVPLALLALSTHRRALAMTPESEDLEQYDVILPGESTLARRALILAPRHIDQPLPVLVLLHGLGETGNELLGIHAWGERYGLVHCYERLRRPPLGRSLPTQRYLTDERLHELSALLHARPFRGLILACPVTPNPHRTRAPTATLDRYADWIEQTLLPAVRNRVAVAEGPLSIGLDGCSLGGYVALEVFLRKPRLFGALGTVQGAFGAASALVYADRLARVIEQVGPRPLLLQSSSGDPYLKANQALSKRLTQLGVPHGLRIAPGPHNQPWLQEIGTLEMLFWHDRQLAP